MNNPILSRRTLLKGAGALMALPWLESLKVFGATGAAAASNRPPVRMAALFMANGVNPNHWTPTGRGADFELSETLQPLARFKNELLVLSELWNAKTDTGDGHYVKTGGFLTGQTIQRTTGSDLRSGTSMDQVAAARIGNFTPLPSLELGLEPITTGVDVNVGYTRLYGSHISWSSPTTPLAKEINPQLAFDRLFRSNIGGRGHDAARDKSVIDLVLEDAKALKKRVSLTDQRKVDEYLASVRSVEKRIAFDAQRRAAEWNEDPLVRAEVDTLGRRIHDFYADPAQASERRGNPTEHTRLMLDLIALSFWTDSTRVGTFMFGNSVSGKNFSFLEGVSGGHHEISHHENRPEKLEQYKRINMWHMEQYAYLLERLRSFKEGDSNVLDNSMILCGAAMRDGNAHSPHNLPILLAGKGGGTLATGRHLAYEKHTPLCNLYVSMLRRMGAPVDQFADSTGELKGLEDPGFSGTA
jgi:hypothetical protein